MKKFLLLLHESTEVLQNLSPQEMQKLVAAHTSWAEKLAEAGHMIAGEGLEERSIRISGKDSIIKDGHFIESKEMIGGFYYLQASTMDEVTELAKECPCHHWGGETEIRPIMEYDQ